MFGTLSRGASYVPSDRRSQYSEQHPQQERKAAREAETESKERKKKKTVKIAEKTDRGDNFATVSSGSAPARRTQEGTFQRVQPRNTAFST